MAGLLGIVLGAAIQWLVFEKEHWAWGIRRDQLEMQVRIDRLENQDLRDLLDVLEIHGAEIKRALLVLGYSKVNEEERK